ncbi:MAG: Rrf2 family transcriptional regulator, partial [Dehalococcoidia bacterium]|nr:Rrf2 family transcriptional regulator [Dehalococcoidia bacterium]
GRYGTRALLDVALHQDDSPVQLKVIAQRQQISLHYLEHIVAPLIAAGLLRSTRGAYGGVSLGKPPQEIKLSEVIQVLEGSITPVECVDDPNVCSRADVCATRDVWTDVKKAMAGVLESVTLQDLVERQKDKQKLVSAMYYI